MKLTYTSPALLLLLSLGLLSLLQGCVGVASVAIVSGATVATDARSLTTQIDDQTIEFNASSKIANNSRFEDTSNIHLVSINGAVLLVGQTPNDELRQLAIKQVITVEGVRKVHNQIRIGSPTSFTTRSNDVWLTSKVKTALFGSDKINASNIKVITENSEVFLMGLIDVNEGEVATDIARNISGVNRVFLAFEYK